jgi:hypothetical protein
LQSDISTGKFRDVKNFDSKLKEIEQSFGLKTPKGAQKDSLLFKFQKEMVLELLIYISKNIAEEKQR